jgi:predicted small integral membrane protein
MSDPVNRPEDPVAAAARAPISVTAKRRRGFLPFSTNTFDRVFISVVLAVAIHLLWMRFLEPEPPGLSLYIATAISAVLAFLIVTRG